MTDARTGLTQLFDCDLRPQTRTFIFRCNITMSILAIFTMFAMMSVTSTSSIIMTNEQLTQAVARLTKQLETCTAERGGGFSTYVHWGSGNCSSDAETVYAGIIGGSLYVHPGAATNHLCVPPDPVYDNHKKPAYGFAHLYGTEYEVYPEDKQDLTPLCSVCRIPRASNIMIPAKVSCKRGWKLEYSGYLMAGYHSHAAGTQYICVDSAFNFLLGTQANHNGALLYYTLSMCGSLPCPPYVNDKIVTCIVCSK